MPDRQTLEHLLQTLTPEAVGELRFVASNTHPEAERLYGGQVLAQAMRAAIETVEPEKVVHSQHAYFLRPGDGRVPVDLAVEVARDGSSFSSRRVVASQHGKPILVSSLSFHKREQGDEFQLEMPEVPAPETLPSDRDLALEHGYLDPTFMITTGTDLDVRIVESIDWRNPVPREAKMHIWIKTTAPVEDRPGLHESLLAYMSDTYLVDAALLPHGRGYGIDARCASLDHALWLHTPVRADQWLLYVAEAQRVGNARGLIRGQFFTREGILVATSMQEALIRPIEERTS